MARALFLFALWLLPACSRPAEVAAPVAVATSPASPSRPSATSTPGAAPPPTATSCAARPSTVYGNEPVVFSVEAAAAGGANVVVTLRDTRGKVLAEQATAPPAEVRFDSVPSGDFALTFGSAQPRCWVTVNRELQRARAHL